MIPHNNEVTKVVRRKWSEMRTKYTKGGWGMDNLDFSYFNFKMCSVWMFVENRWIV